MSDEPGSSPASIEVAMPDAAWNACLPNAEDWVIRVAGITLARALVGDSRTGRAAQVPIELSFVLTDDCQLRDLNFKHRGLDRPTNVLSFPAIDWRQGPGALLSGTMSLADRLPDLAAAVSSQEPLLLGDVVIARETTLAEAEQQGKTPANHLAHLVVHGVLHLLGYDHEDEAEALQMEALEASILGRLGIANPYQEQLDARSSSPSSPNLPEQRT